mmetsp:Transcript_37102/g.94807  ORF Transcript_37102/g.94807 Transcript_37102/m.94807 type:complete len:278 (-) Transcript_37102:1749-2582(-)
MLCSLASSFSQVPRRMLRMRPARAASASCSITASPWTLSSIRKKACTNSKSCRAATCASTNCSSISTSATSSSVDPSKSSRARTSRSIADGLMERSSAANPEKSPVSAPNASMRANSDCSRPEPLVCTMRLPSCCAPPCLAASVSNTGCRPMLASALVGRKKGAASGFFAGCVGLLRSLMMSSTARDSHWLRGSSDSVTSCGSASPPSARMRPSSPRRAGSSAPPPSSSASSSPDDEPSEGSSSLSASPLVCPRRGSCSRARTGVSPRDTATSLLLL